MVERGLTDMLPDGELLTERETRLAAFAAPFMAMGAFFTRLRRERPVGLLGALICLAMLAVAAAAPLIAPEGYNAINPIARLKPPSAQHWFGTDHLGRDVFARIVHGAQLSVVVAFGAATLSTLISALIGLASGYAGGRVDMVTQRFVDGWMAFPDLLILIVAASLFTPSTFSITIVLGVVLGMNGSRIVRSAVLTVKQNTYVHVARSIGASWLHILWRHILPNIAPVLIIIFTTRLGIAILAEAGLGFLGLGIPPPAPSWGGMLSVEGRNFMFQAPWLATFPGLALTLAVFAMLLFGDAVRDLLDPRLKGGGGRYAGAVRRDGGGAK